MDKDKAIQADVLAGVYRDVFVYVPEDMSLDVCIEYAHTCCYLEPGVCDDTQHTRLDRMNFARFYFVRCEYLNALSYCPPTLPQAHVMTLSFFAVICEHIIKMSVLCDSCTLV